MQSVTELLQSPSTTPTPAGRTDSTRTITELRTGDRDFINRLFAQLQAIFPAWRAAFPDDQAVTEAKRQWIAGLVHAGVTDVETIKAGLRIARRSQSPFLPSVGQFIGWCEQAKVDALGLPSVVEVQRQMIAYVNHRRMTSVPEVAIHPLAFWVYRNIDYYRWNQMHSDKADKILEKIYAEGVSLAVSGAELPEPPVLIGESASPAEPSAEQVALAEASRAALRGMFGGSSTPDQEPV